MPQALGSRLMPAEPEPPLAVVRFPADPDTPIRISFLSVPVEAMIVDKESVPLSARKIPSDWGVAGVYVLLGPATDTSAKIRARGACQVR